MSAFDDSTVNRALRHLRSSDPVMKKLIAGHRRFQLRRPASGFSMLARSITSQQISTKAARSIQKRLCSLLPGGRLSPHSVAALKPDQLRSAGLSLRKAEYLHGLAGAFADGSISTRRLARLDDEAVVNELSALRGIGRWTAQMFLMFGLGRPDVLPHDDFGIRSAIRNLYELDELPDRPTCHTIGEPWRPYASIACWYCWRSLEPKA